MSQGSAPRTLLDDCVHCGFCLPACPTYVSSAHEADSPRGRIDMLRGLSEGKLEWTGSVALHLDRCLGCLGCVTACPSGVRYDVLLSSARAELERKRPRPAAESRLREGLLGLLTSPRRLRLVLLPLILFTRSGLRALARTKPVRRFLGPSLSSLLDLAPDVSWRHLSSSLPRVTPASGTRRARVGLLSGCVQGTFFPGVNEATVRVLAAEGCEVVVPERQGCCGALSAHVGREEEARRMARDLIARFESERLDWVVVNAAGCGTSMKEYGRLLSGDPAWGARAEAFSARVKDVTELLVLLGPVAPRGEVKATAACHDACHLVHGQGIRTQPRRLLGAIPGLELVEIPDAEQCCGSAGVYNLLRPEEAEEIGRRKAASVLSTGADLLISANPGCTLQIQRHLRETGRTIRAMHTVELLDASIRAAAAHRRPELR